MGSVKVLVLIPLLVIFIVSCLLTVYPSLSALQENALEVKEKVAMDDNASDFLLAFDESYGFFDDIPAKDWELLRTITMGRVNNENPKNPRMRAAQPNAWYQTNWDPDFSCRHDTKVGVGDGAKWVCDPQRLVSQSKRRMEQYEKENKTAGVNAGCLIYSVGSQGDFRFEAGVADLIPGACETHTFDFQDYTSRVPPGKNIFFHAWGFKPSYLETKGARDGRFGQMQPPKGTVFKTFAEIKKDLGHEDRPIDIFKIDCEGCEWSTYKDWIDADIRQLLVEVHRVPPVAQDFFLDLQRAGYVTFHKEPNIQYAGGTCVEYAMIKLDRKFVEERIEAQNNVTGTQQRRRVVRWLQKDLEFATQAVL